MKRQKYDLDEWSEVFYWDTCQRCGLKSNQVRSIWPEHCLGCGTVLDTTAIHFPNGTIPVIDEKPA